MSCNGCRVLRKGCSEACILRSCLHWIKTSEAQGNATLFLAKFFGRSDLLNFISSAPENQRPAVFQSLLFEACGRTVNPVNGAVGLLSSGNWHVCEEAVETVLAGGALRPIPGVLPLLTDDHEESTDTFCTDAWMMQNFYSQSKPFVRVAAKETQPSDLNLSLTPNSAFARKRRSYTMTLNSEKSETTCSFGGAGGDDRKKLLNLFV